jgi:hypothetical protein
MSITPTEAADALRDIEDAGRRSGRAFGYRLAGPNFMLWGLVWIIGYAGNDLVPSRAGLIWLGATLSGAIASAFLGRTGPQGRTRGGWRIVALVAIVALFITATMTVMWPVAPKQQAAFVPLLAAACYAGVGLWAGLRWVIAGAMIAVLTLGGFFLIHAHFNLWMAAVGGGGLVLAGLWMRSA